MRSSRGFILALLFLCWVGCDRDPQPTASQAPATPSPSVSNAPPPTPAAPGQPRPNYATGRATDTSGKPLAGVQIGIGGTTIAHGENVHFKTTTAADGGYALPLPHGVYKVSAKILAKYRERSYLLPMHPADGTVDDSDSANGIVRDFVWRLSGLKPGVTPGSTKASHYYGGAIELKDRNSYEDRVGFNVDEGPGSRPLGKHLSFAPGTVLAVTMKPDGPLIDGSAGKELSFQIKIDASMNYDYNWPDWFDIPIGRYTLTAEIRPPGASAKPARVAAVNPHEAKGAPVAKPDKSVPIDFIPDTSQTYAGGTHPVMVYVME